jgi:hypothetical protein
LPLDNAKVIAQRAAVALALCQLESVARIVQQLPRQASTKFARRMIATSICSRMAG